MNEKKKVSVKIGDITLSQIRNTCANYSDCLDCPLYFDGYQRCRDHGVPFDTERVIEIYEKDLK